MDCPVCHKDCELQKLLFSADSELEFIFMCLDCKRLVQWKVFATALAHRALMNDMEKTHKKEVQTGPIKPPLQLPAGEPDLKLTKQDRRDLKSLHILPPEDEP
jgi:hypothetical protein